MKNEKKGIYLMNTHMFEPIPLSSCFLSHKILEIDLDALCHNYLAIKGAIFPARCVPVVKANAYGVGALPAVKALVSKGASEFFVATCEEGIFLRKHFPSIAIYILDGVDEASCITLYAHRLTPVLNSLKQVEILQIYGAKKSEQLPCLLHVDSGMIRLGLSPDEAIVLGKTKEKRKNLNIQCIMSHLACSGPNSFSATQKAVFEEVCRYWPGIPKSLGTSQGYCLGKDYFYDCVRPGLILYGATPNAPLPIKAKIKNVITVKAKILHIQKVDANVSVGYERTFFTDRPSRLATLGIGYADGYPRSLSNKGWGYFKGYKLPVAGLISMDLTVLDITDIPEKEIAIGEWIELIGPHVSIEEVATLAQTHAYEMMTLLGNRYHRLYKPSYP